MTYKEALRKRKFETALARPIVMLGKLFSKFFRPNTQHGLFIFSPSADIGGANMNNADIAKLFPGKKPIVIFSKRPKNNGFIDLYQSPDISIWDLHKKIDYKQFHFVNIFYRGVIAAWINETPGAVVIGGESLYFHKVFPWLHKDVKTIELTHQLTWFNYTQQFVKDIGTRVFSTQKMLEAAKDFYKQQKIADKFTSRMVFIDNMIDIPEYENTAENQTLEVVYIGRGSPEKRLHLLAEIAKQINQKILPIHFSFVGDVEKFIDPQTFPYCTFYGNVKDRKMIINIQRQSDVLLLTSSFEGLPMVIIEMMSLGKVIVSTAVNAIPDYIKDGVNGFLIQDSADEKLVIKKAIEILIKLQSDPTILKKIGKENIRYAREHFSKEAFVRNWAAIIDGKN